MIRRLLGTLALSFVTGVIPAALAAAPVRFVPGELIVRYRPGITELRRAAVRTRLGARIGHTFPIIQAEHLRLPEGLDVGAAIVQLNADPSVVYAEPNYEWSILEVPDDPLFPQQWALQNTGQTGGTAGADIRTVTAWDHFTGDPDLRIGVIDTGIDWRHPDLAANVWTNPDEVPGNFIDDDHNGYVDDVHGYDCVNDDGDPSDDNGHGTHVAGTIAAVGNNGIGVAGVVWRAQLVGIKVLGSGGVGTTASTLRGMQYALQAGVRVSNASWGGPVYSQALSDAIAALGADGQLFVAAAGNAALNNDVVSNYPSGFNLPCIISVAATNERDQLALFSNYGATTVDVAAPGTSIVSLAPGGGYQVLSGTSMASPHVTGVVALAIGRHPGTGSEYIKELVLAHAEPLPQLEGKVARGRLNALLPVQGADVVAPATIADLRITDLGSSHVGLAWTAPGDDGIVGRAFDYELRYANTPIVDQPTFRAALRAAGTPRPQLPGTGEHFELRGLTPGATWYIAIAARDEFGNAGALANPVTTATLAAPRAGLANTPLVVALPSGGIATGTITIRNDGPGTLDFTIPTPGLPILTSLSQSGEPWAHESITGDDADRTTADENAGPRAFKVGGPDPFGYRWMDNNGTGPAGPAFDWADITQVGELLPLAGNDEVSAPIPIGFHFPFYGNLFTTVRVCTNGWVSFNDSPAFYLNRPLPDPVASARNLIAPFWDDLDFRGVRRAYVYNDGTRFIVSWMGVWQAGAGGPYTFQLLLYPSGEIRCQYYSMGKVPYSATIGIQNSSGTIGLMSVFNALYVQSGLAIRYRPPHIWFGVQPAEGRLASGHSQELSWRIDALGLGARALDGALIVATNDPARSSTYIPVHLDVRDAADMATVPDQLDFGTSVVGNLIPRAVTAWNPGTEPLVVTGFTSSEPDLQVEPATFTIPAKAFRAVTLSLRGATAREFDGWVGFATNDPDENPFRIPVRGRVRPAPSLRVSAPPLVAALAKALGATASVRDLPIGFENPGGSELKWRAARRPIWIRTVRDSGTVPPGGRDTLVVRLDATDMIDGDYTGELEITSNDPQHPRLAVPAAIHVGLAAAQARLTPRTLHIPSSGQWVKATFTPPPGIDPGSIAATSVRLMRSVPAVGDGQVAPGAGTITFAFDRAAVQAALAAGPRVAVELIARAAETTWLAAVDTIDVTRAAGSAQSASNAARPERLWLRRIGAHPAERPGLELELPRAGAVVADVFDAGGARVRRLAGGDYDAGFHPLLWDGRDDHGRMRSAGVYFVRVSTLGEVLTTRVVKIE